MFGPPWTHFNHNGDICLGNICPGDVCPYPEFLSCYWPNFDQTLNVGSWEHLLQMPSVMDTFVQATFVLATFVHERNILAIPDPILTKLLGPNFLGAFFLFTFTLLDPNFFGPKKSLEPKFFWTQNLLGWKFHWTQTFLDLNCWDQIFLDRKFYGPKIFWTQNVLDPKFFVT